MTTKKEEDSDEVFYFLWRVLCFWFLFFCFIRVHGSRSHTRHETTATARKEEDAVAVGLLGGPLAAANDEEDGQ